jgi:alpha-tubulin suppressor-like RCC1 family protein
MTDMRAMADTGDLYTWGEGAGGRLGHGDEEDHKEPHQVASLRGTRIVQIACGFAHMAALSGTAP